MNILFQSKQAVFGATNVEDGAFSPLSVAPHDPASPLVASFVSRVDELVRAKGIFPEEIVTLRMCHGNDVEVASLDGEVLFSNVDGLVTKDDGVLLVITGADCPPVFVLDEATHAIGLAHSGRRGTLGNIAKELVEKMKNEFGSDPSAMSAVIGPGICAAHYEVTDDIAKPFELLYPDRVKISEKAGHANLDLAGIVKDELVASGLAPKAIQQVGGCTFEQENQWFSHRRDEQRNIENLRLNVFFAMISQTG